MDDSIHELPMDSMGTGKDEHVYKKPKSEKIEQVNNGCGKPRFDVMKLAKLAIYGAMVVGLVGFTVAIVSVSAQVNRLKSELAGYRAKMKAGVNEVTDTAQDQVARMSSDLRDFQAKGNTSLQLQLEVQEVIDTAQDQVARMSSDLRDFQEKINTSLQLQLEEHDVGVSEAIDTTQDQVARMSRDLRDFQAKVNTSLQLQLEVQDVGVSEVIDTAQDQVARMSSDLRDFQAKVNTSLQLQLEEGVSEVIDTAQDQVARMSSDLRDFQEKVNTSLQLQLEEQDVGVGGAVYIRWGRTVCPENSTTVYAGIAAGSKLTDTGGSSTTICLPGEPIFGNHYSGGNPSLIYGTEYEDGADLTAAIFGRDVDDEDVPCVVCEATGRRSKMFVPARNVCYSGWHLEYSGYLMTAHHMYQRTDMKCVDHNPETVNGQSSNDNGNGFYFVEAYGKIPDPPYTRGKELTCAICTK